ncbi:MAG: ATP-binding protein [Candidatus Moeniiplasma glomeromycotorum]|nr:ATP-binding protein [Candidatus Moeniiplasma glomeromycotorum]
MAEKKKKEENQYSSAEDYQVLEEIEHVRRYPGNYIGSTSEQGWHHLAQEVIDNSIDEAVAGRCDQIKVVLSPDQRTITIEDNGQGMPIKILPGTTQTVLANLLSRLRSGGKFGGKIYKTSGGMHGIGITAVNFLSQELKVWNRRQGQTQILEFNRGILKKEEIIDSSQETDGLTVTFTPDPKVFQEFTYFKIETIQNRLKDLAYLNPNVTLIFLSSPEATPITYHYNSGLAGLVKEINQENYLENIEICLEEWSDLTAIRKDEEGNWIKENFYLNFAWQYSKGGKVQLKSFCNNIRTEGGGSHLVGFGNGFVSAVRDWIKEKYPDLKIGIKTDDIMEGLVAVVAIRMGHPQFFGQTKYSLEMNPVREVVKNATYDLVKKFLQDHASSAEAISQKVIEAAQNRAKTEEYQKSLREGGRSVALPGKLAPCISKEIENNELFIVEGESAGGSAKSARNPTNQAVLPLQGKIINVIKAKWSQILKNKEINNLINALGFTITEATQNYYNRFQKKLETPDISQEELEIPEEFVYQDDTGQEQIIPAHTPLTLEQVKTIVEKTKERLLKKVRYGKIVIMTDADEDGDHIGCLSFAFFIRYFRYLIEDHRLFLAATPLYRWRTKEKTIYFYNDHEWNEYKQNPKNKGVGGTLQKFKGLGEMNPQQLRDVAMAAEKRCLHGLVYSNQEAVSKMVQDLMGAKSEPRKKLLDSGEHKHSQLRIVDGKVDIDQALLVKFLSYAYEVVENRALPQLQDGLKPVQRYILYALYELGCLPSRPHRKAAGAVGDVIRKYHAHGDQSIYQAMVKMAQDFNYRYPLVDGQGNWGSIDGDPAAAYRYTEARLSPFGLYLLKDLIFETVVNWKDNYDNTEKEPEYLPPHPNLLLNGSSGIAVGMSANIPPHNLGEVVDTTIELINNPQLSTEELIISWKCSGCQAQGRGKTSECSQCQSTEINFNYFGPDFPTGGQILEREKLKEIYENGEGKGSKGTIYIRAKAEITSSNPDKGKKDLIRITELPFKTNKSSLVVKASQIIKDKKIPGLKSIADYSNFEDPVNIHFYFDPDYDGKVILNQLYKKTQLQSTFSFKMRSLIGNQPKVFSLKEIFQAFIDRKLEIIQRKAYFICYKTQKKLTDLKIRLFKIDNYEKIGQIIKGNPSKEEAKKQLIKEFWEEMKELRDATVDLFLIDLIIKAERAVGEIQVQIRQRNEAIKKEKYKEFIGLMRQIDVYKNEKGYQNRESEINEIKEKITDLDIEKSKEELSDASKLPEDYINPEQKVINTIISGSFSFESFFLEEQKKLKDDVEVLKKELTNQQLLIIHQEQRKQQLISELEELKKDYADDYRRTIITSQLHLIAERQLIPHEKRIILLSRSENKKENKFNNYLTVHNLAAVEPTNIPSVGRELKTRGDNWAIIKLDRRDDLWCFSNYGKLYELSFYKFAALNKTTNLNEEYFMKMRKGELKPTLQAEEFFTAALTAPEEFTQKFLLIITKKGKIKFWGSEKLKNISKSGKKLINLYQKTIEKCSQHQSQLTEHKAVAHACGIGCSQRRELQKQIKACNNCKVKWTGSGDEIAKSALIENNEEIELIIKRKSKDGVAKNIKVSLYRTVRKKDKEGSPEYCSEHKTKLKKHKTANCCDKSQGVKVYSRCAKFRKLRNEIKVCGDCQNPELFTKQIRKQVKCEKVVDLLIIEAGKNKENLLLLLIKKDNNCEKRPLVKVKNWISSDSRVKKVDYCQKHWSDLEKLNQAWEKAERGRRQEREIMEERVLKSTLPLEVKEKILKEIKIITGINTKEMAKKIAASPIDLTVSEAAINNLAKDLKQKGEVYQKLLAEVKKQQDKINNFKEKNIKKCLDCQKYCSQHEQETRDIMVEHETCKHCHQYDRQINQLKEKREKLKKKLENLKKAKPGATKEIQKLVNELAQKKEEGEKLRHQALGNRTKCPILNQLKVARKNCPKCQGQERKKHRVLAENPLRQVCLVDREKNAEIYLLANEGVCWYNKKDLDAFLTGSGKSKRMLRDEKRIITDIKFYSS